MLYRTKSRDVAAALLIAAGTDAGARVSKDRSEPFESESGSLPAIAVFTPSETSENRSGGGPPMFKMTVEMVIRAQVAGTDDAVTGLALDNLCEQIEDALLTDNAFIGLFEQIIALDTHAALSSEGHLVPGAADIIIRAEYNKQFDVVIDTDLKTLAADWDMAGPRNDPQIPTGPDGQIDAQDELDIPII